MIENGRIVHEVRYPHPVPAVWRALTERASLATWLMPNDFELAVGQGFRFDASPGFGIVDGEVLSVEAPHLLKCRWVIEGRPSTVTFRLHADGSETVLHLEHDGLGPGAATSFDGGWGSKLDYDLPRVLAGGRDPSRAVDEDGLTHHPDRPLRPRNETEPEEDSP
ncbi:MAG TPA: SRPBCC domain-containing protein [Acidimicrobiia bacterium]|nr:SRPBCC domain-containing protein [Acidimicrobiia bacterium]